MRIVGLGPTQTAILRDQPDANAKAIATLSAGAKHIDVIAQAINTRDWLKIRSDKIEGWMEARYLSFDSAHAPFLPARLQCRSASGALNISYSRADFDGVGGKDLWALEPPQAFASGWTVKTHGQNAVGGILRVDPKHCALAGSAESFPFAVAVQIGEFRLSGCCL